MTETENAGRLRSARLLIAGWVPVIIVLGLVLTAQAMPHSTTVGAAEGSRANAMTGNGDECVACHRQSTPGIVGRYGVSTVALPDRKSQAYFLMVSMGCLATVISSVLEHARTGFLDPWLWLPAGVGVFAIGVAGYSGAIDDRRRMDLPA